MIVLDVDWRTLLTSPEWASAMQSRDRIHLDSRVEVIDAEGVHLADLPVVSGTVSMEGESSEQWAATLTLVDQIPQTPDDEADPLSGNRVRIWWREYLPGLGGWGEVLVMTGWPQDPRTTDDGVPTGTLTVRDSITEAKRGGYRGQTVEAGGMTVTAALNAIFEAVAPTIPRRIPDSPILLPTVYTLAGTDPSKDWTDVAAVAGWIVRSDREGVIVAGPAPDPTSPAADWQAGQAARVDSYDRERTTSGIKNRWVCRTTSSDITPPLQVVVEDDDEASPTWVGRLGPYEGTIESDTATTEEALRNLGVAALVDSRRPTEVVKVRVDPRPDLDYRDIVLLARPESGVGGEYRVASWRLPLPGPARAPELMEIEMMARSVT